MELKSIFSVRKFERAVFWQIVWEWEDALAPVLQLKRIDRMPFWGGLRRGVIDRLLSSKPCYGILHRVLGRKGLPALSFHMNPPYCHGHLTRKDVIPIIIDCWRGDVKRVVEFFPRHRAIFLCSLEAVEAVKKLDSSLPVHFLPVSLPQASIPTQIPTKDIDLLCYSRCHPVLMEWAGKYVLERPGTRFARTGRHEGRLVLFEAGQEFDLGTTREAILNVVGRSRIVLQSSPGCYPEGEVRTGGFNPVTPRFLEAASRCCHMVGIYPKNGDFTALDIESLCRHVSTYAEFRDAVDQLLRTPFDLPRLAAVRCWLERNSTETRGKEISKVLATI